MDLLRACDELKAVVHTAQLLIAQWEDNPTDGAALEEQLTDLASELKRIQGDAA